MATIIDKRNVSDNRSLDNRKRFIDLLKRKYRKEIEKKFSRGNITEDGVSKDNNYQEDYILADFTAEEPILIPDPRKGKWKRVFPGNDICIEGEEIVTLGRMGEGEVGKGNEFIGLSTDEYIEILFDNCELPKFLKKSKKIENDFDIVPYGFCKSGAMNKISIIRSYRESLLRRFARISELKKLIKNEKDEEKIKVLEEKLKKIPLFEDTDLRFQYNTKKSKLGKSGVFIMALDVSGSMEEEHRYLAKSYFYLMYRFLLNKYDSVRTIFIHHTNEAEVVEEMLFFDSEKTGGTEFSPVYELINKIIDTELDIDSENIYIAHASDTEVYENDLLYSIELINNKIINKINLGIYLNINPQRPEGFGHRGGVLPTAELENKIKSDKFQVLTIKSRDDIVPNFLKVFKK